MATTNFVDQNTVVEAAWLNDIDNIAYAILDAAVGTAGAARTALAAAGLADDNAFTGSNSNAWTELTDAATVAVDFSVGSNFFVTVTAGRTIGAPTNKVAGQSGLLVVEQDGTGVHTTTFNAAWDFGGTGNPTPTTVAGDKAVIAYAVDWDSVVVSSFVGDF